MKTFWKNLRNQRGGLTGDLILWLLGVPLPLIILFSILRGCR